MKLIPIEQDGKVATEGQCTFLPEVLELTVDLYGRRGFEPPWTGYVAEEHGTVVGACSFVGPPSDGEVEIAYFTFPGNEGRGFATRMASELLALTEAAAAELGLAYIAYTLPQENASTVVLRRLGFTLLGPIDHPEDGIVWKWRKT